MDLKIKLFGILVNDKDEILLKKEDYSLPGDDIIVGCDLISSIKKIIKEKTNINLIDIILFDEASLIEEDTHTLAIFYIGTFFKDEILKINQVYKWCKLKKIDLEKVDYFTKFVIRQILE